MKFVVCSFLTVLSLCNLCLAESPTTVNWETVERQLYADLKGQGRSEAEIEEAIGHGLLSDNQWQRAVVHLKKAVELDQKRYLAFYDLGLVYAGSTEGEEYFRKSAEGVPAGWYWLGYGIVRSGGRDAAAVPIFEKYLATAKGSEESGRIEVARKVLAELKLGQPGAEVAKIRQRGARTHGD